MDDRRWTTDDRLEIIISRLVRMLDDAEVEARQRAVAALVEISDAILHSWKAEAQHIEASMTEDWSFGEALSELSLDASPTNALLKIGKTALPSLLRALAGETALLRAGVLSLLELEEFRDPRAVDPILAALHDVSALVRAEAALVVETYAINGFVDRHIVRAQLLEQINDAHPKVRESVIHVLGHIGNAQDFPLLLSLLRNTEELIEIRGEAAQALGQLREAPVLDILVQALTDEQTKIRARAALGLRNLADPRALPALLSKYEDAEEDWLVRTCARDALSHLGITVAHIPYPEEIPF